MSKIQQTPPDDFYDHIRDILTSAQTRVAQTVNTAQFLSNWLIGREIVEEEQQGQQRATYGETLLKNLAKRLKQDFGEGYSYTNLKYIRQFYLSFPQLLTETEISHAVRDQSVTNQDLSGLSNPKTSWQTGQLHPNLSWTHYRILMKVEKLDVRSFAVVKYTLNSEQ